MVERVNGVVDLQSERIRKSFEGKENSKLYKIYIYFIGSFEPGEDWEWCYIDKSMIE
jgi:hypothetical protein